MATKYPITQIRKYSLILIHLLFWSCQVNHIAAQNYSITDKKAIKYFEEGQKFYQNRSMTPALEEINKAIERSPNFLEAHTLLGYIYLDLNNVESAKSSFKKAVEIDPQKIPNNLYFLGELYLKDGEYQLSKQYFDDYIKTNPSDDRLLARSQRSLSKAEFGIKAMSNPIEFEPQNLGPEINTQYAEYFPCLTVDESTIIFTRRLPFPEAPQGFNEDFFISTKNKEDEWSLASNLGSPINTKNNEGAPSLSADGEILFFTACELYGDYGGGRKGRGSCDIFYTLKDGKDWIQPMNLGPNINTGHWETQPSFSADGTTLYFVRGKRDRSGNRTGDIYTSKLKSDGYWSEPIKLPANVNTPGNEESVFIHPDGKTLYFASNGHMGMGGLDIFKTEKNEDGSWSDPLNLGYPINTHKNENSLLVAASGELAYFASDREDGYGDLDLYQFKLNETLKPNPVTYFSGRIYDAKTNKNIGAKFELIDLQSQMTVAESYSNSESGKFLLSLPYGKEYALNVSKKGYLFYSDYFKLDKGDKNKPFVKNVGLQPIEKGESVVLNNIFFETAKFDLKESSEVELKKLYDFMVKNPNIKIEISGHTDNIGNASSNKTLSKNRAESVKSYLQSLGIESTRMNAVGYGADQPIADNKTEEGRAKNRRTEFSIL